MSEICKYRLSELLSKFTPAAKKIKTKELAEKLDIKERTLHLYFRAAIGDPINMNTDKLLICAEFFGVSLDELVNTQKEVA